MPEDIGIMVAACRVTYGKAITKRNENKKKKSANKKQEEEILSMLDMGSLLS